MVFTLDNLQSLQIHNKIVVTIDVLRATTSMITAFEHGVTSIISVSEIEKAVKLKKNDPKSLLCGERNGERISGFDRGNSPFEYKELKGFNLIFCSTNGSKTIDMTKDSKKMYLGALINAEAVAKLLIEKHIDDDILFVCSGKLGRACVEDTICAGYIITKIIDKIGLVDMDDASKIAISYYNSISDSLEGTIRNSEHGKYLASIGSEKDVEYCTMKDSTDIIPFFDKDDYEIKI